MFLFFQFSTGKCKSAANMLGESHPTEIHQALQFQSSQVTELLIEKVTVKD
jgi:hypothetical protein